MFRCSLSSPPGLPPQQPDAEQQFIDVKEAYETLSDEERRREFDRVNRLGRRVGFFQDVEEEVKGVMHVLVWGELGRCM